MDKYNSPNLPTPLHVLEDLSSNDIVKSDYQIKLSLKDVLKQAYTCYSNCTQLEEDLDRQNETNKKLEELNTKLITNIDNMKKQSK